MSSVCGKPLRFVPKGPRRGKIFSSGTWIFFFRELGRFFLSLSTSPISCPYLFLQGYCSFVPSGRKSLGSRGTPDGGRTWTSGLGARASSRVDRRRQTRPQRRVQHAGSKDAREVRARRVVGVFGAPSPVSYQKNNTPSDSATKVEGPETRFLYE